MTSIYKAPERIWAWDDKTPIERYKGWSTCYAGTGSAEYVRADLHEAARAEIDRLTAERDTALAQVAAVFEAAAQAAFDRTPGKDPATIAAYVTGKSIENAIRALTPADASAALSRMLDAAHAAGQERMREAAADRIDDAMTIEGARRVIRALPITPRPDREDRT